LVDDPASNTWLAWLPDEGSLLFSSNRNQGNFSIWSIDLATSRQREIIPPLSYQPDVGLLKAYFPLD
jgi:Tol biopolymer transport system component